VEASSHDANWLARFRQYLLDVRGEFEKISWPTQKEYVGGTVGVLVIVTFMTIVLGGLDAVFSWAFEKLIQLLNG
jgi:preprotein translocase subunit SecE